MSFTINETIKNTLLLPRYAKQITVIIFDIGLCVLCTWLAFYLRLEKFITINDITLLAALLSVFLAIPIFWFFRLRLTSFN